MGGPNGEWGIPSPGDRFYFTSASPAKTREDFPQLPTRAWEDLSSGRLRVGATRYKRKGKTDVIMWKGNDKFVGFYFEVIADKEYYLKRVPPQFGVDPENVAEIAAFASAQWNDDMWFYVHVKGYSPSAARHEVAVQDGEFLKGVISYAMTILGSGPSVVKPTGTGPRPSRVTPTSRRGDPTHVYKEVPAIGSGVKHAGNQAADWMKARNEAEFKGKYSELNHSFYYPDDADKYGTKKEWEVRYEAMRYARFNVPAGYWVWVFPFYYIWDKKS